MCPPAKCLIRLGFFLILPLLALVWITPSHAQGAFPDADTVPVPPDTLRLDTLQWNSGYVPNVYAPSVRAKAAPDPPTMLRPRYKNGGQESSKTENLPEKTNPIRQVASLEEPGVAASQERADSQLAEPTALPDTPPIRQPMFWARAPDVPQAFKEEFFRRKQLSTRRAERQNHDRFAAERYTKNDNHTCDELTCGRGGCGSASRSGLWFFDAWADVGSLMNTDWPEDRNNAPLRFNDRNGEPVLNQLYLSLGRRIDARKNHWDFGGRVDLLYGTDYFYTSSLGLETHNRGFSGDQTLDPLEAMLHWNSNTGQRRAGTAGLYGLSLPQVYGEIFMPYGYGVTLKVGHFFAAMGLESAMSPQNFFYSHSYSFMYGQPVTVTGATATLKLGPRLSAIGGFTSGWNIFDTPTGNGMGMLGLKYQSLDKRRALSFVVHSGPDTLRGNDNRTNYALTYQHKIGRRWHYALEHTFGYEEDGAFTTNDMTERRSPARWISLAQYLQYRWNEKWSFGLRGEWFRDDGHSRIQKGSWSVPYGELSGKDYYEITLGANWKPTRLLTIRPEIRYDWSNVKVFGQGGVYTGQSKSDMFSFAIDGVLRF